MVIPVPFSGIPSFVSAASFMYRLESDTHLESSNLSKSAAVKFFLLLSFIEYL